MTRRSTYSDAAFDAKLGSLKAVRTTPKPADAPPLASVAPIAPAPARRARPTSADAPRPARRRAEPSATARARPDHPKRITVDLTEEQWQTLRAMRTVDASRVNSLVRALIEVVSEDRELIERVRERAELEGP